MADKHIDKRSEAQFNMDPYDGGEDPFYSWNVENHEEMLNQAEKEHEEKEK
jgi:hypothetical protein